MKWNNCNNCNIRMTTKKVKPRKRVYKGPPIEYNEERKIKNINFISILKEILRKKK